jgi:hypothetical protein
VLREENNVGGKLHAISLDYNNSHTMQQVIDNITGTVK